MTFKDKMILNERGLTLIEVLIAIVILSFIVLGIASITGSSQDTALKVVAEDRQILQVETAMARIEWDVSQAYSPLFFSHAMEPSGLSESEGQVYNEMVDRYTTNSRFAFPSYEGLPVPIFEARDKKQFTFFTTSNRRKFKNSKQSHFAWVRYDLDTVKAREEDGEDTKALIRKFNSENVFSPQDIQWEDVKSQILLRNVEKLVFEFWNPGTSKWTENFATVKDGAHIIRGIKVNLEWIDPDGIKRTFIRVFRPLYPNFEPENMYEFLKTSPTTNTSGRGSNSSNQSGSN